MGQKPRARRARVRDQALSVVFFAGGVYVILMGVLGFAGHPRGVAPEIGPGLYWFTYIVSGAALLAGGVLVVRRGRPFKAVWWLTMIAALPGFLLWLYGAVVGAGQMMLATGPSAGEELAAIGVLFAFALLGLVGWLRVRRLPGQTGKKTGGAGAAASGTKGAPAGSGKSGSGERSSR